MSTPNRLTYVKDSRVEFYKGRRLLYAIFKCECGKETETLFRSVLSDKVKSCGCLQREAAALQGRSMKSHGMSTTSTYHIWQSMKQRCYDKNNINYDNYGGRGITVCDDWLAAFQAFYADMGERPDGLTLERIDNNKGYNKNNCKWATYTEQSYNRRNT